MNLRDAGKEVLNRGIWNIVGDFRGLDTEHLRSGVPVEDYWNRGDMGASHVRCLSDLGRLVILSSFQERAYTMWATPVHLSMPCPLHESTLLILSYVHGNCGHHCCPMISFGQLSFIEFRPNSWATFIVLLMSSCTDYWSAFCRACPQVQWYLVISSILCASGLTEASLMK